MNTPSTAPAGSTAAQRPITLLLCALGGEGGGVLTDWIVATALRLGYPVQATSVPGVAQRTGATTYYVEIFPVPLAQLGGRRPVLSLNPVPGALDAIVSSELLETTRQLANGMSDPARTVVISAVNRALTTAERMVPGDGRHDTAALLAVVRDHSRAHQLLDMQGMAQANGTVVSAVMLGALAASGVLPFDRADFEATIGQGGGKASAASQRGFAQAWDAVRAGATPHLLPISEQQTQSGYAESGDFSSDFPSNVSAIAQLGLNRLTEYQDAAYAALYRSRLQALLLAEREASHAASAPADVLPDGAVTAETARWLALWMAYDDVARVAELKSRAARWARVRGEARVAPGDLLRVYDHFKPGVPEIAGLLPTGLAQRLLRWDAQRVAAGRAPWALPLRIGSHSATGLLALRAMATLRGVRRLGSRYAEEQRQIDAWLAAITTALPRAPALALELARCGRLIKGYGSTHARGLATLHHLMAQAATLADPHAAARAVAAAREAALADDSGKALDGALRQHGVAPRPLREQPIRFVRQPKGMSQAPHA